MRSPSLSRPIVDYLIALGVCLTAASAYRVTVVPWLQPETTPVVVARDDKEDLAGPDLSGIFAEGAWQRSKPKMLEAEWGTLLFQHWEQREAERIRVHPVTVILRRGATELDGSDPNTGPVILEAEEGAIVEFEQAPSVLSGASPKIKGGQLIGEVHIYSLGEKDAVASARTSATAAPRDAIAPDAIDLTTRNVRIDNRQIRSAEQVDLRIGAAHIRGRDLTIHLAGGGTLSTNTDSPLSVLDSLELIYLDEFSLPLAEGPLWQPLDSALASAGVDSRSDDKSAPRAGPSQPVHRLPRKPGFSQASARLDHSTAPRSQDSSQTPAASTWPAPSPAPSLARLAIHCQGRVVFDFPTFTLRMFDQVEINHHWSASQFDQFRCRLLEIQLVDPFYPSPSQDVAADQETDEDDGSVQAAYRQVHSVLRRVTASGFPLEAEVPSLASHLVAGELEVDVTAGKLKLTASDRPVSIRYGGITVAMPGCEYHMNVDDPAALGTFLCNGAGKLVVEDETVLLRELTWQRALKLLPHEEGHQMWLEGQIRAALRDGGSAGAEKFLAIFETSTTGGTESASSRASQASATARPPVHRVSSRSDVTSVTSNASRVRSADTSPEDAPASPLAETVQLKKLWAAENVFADTRSMGLATDQMFVLFEHLPTIASSQVLGEDDSLAGPALNPATGPRLRNWITGPEDEGAEPGAPRGPRPVLRGQQVNASVLLQNGQIVSQDVSVERNVRLDHQLASRSGPLPLVYTGDSLRLMTGDGGERVQIAGSPARIDLGDGYFSGPLVVVDGSQNRVLIRDHGTFQMPTSAIPQGGEARFEWPQPPRCDFRGELVFDGQVVEITDQVHLSGKIKTPANGSSSGGQVWNITADAPTLKLILNQGVQVTEPTSVGEVNVDLISLIGGQRAVQVVADQITPEGTLGGRHVLINPRLDLVATTGHLRGAGPGWYRAWTPAKEDSPMRSIAPPGSLMATHLIYNGGLEGDLNRQQLMFFRGVRVGLGTVANWNEQIDAATMTQLEMNQGTIDCDRLRLGRSPSAARVPGSVPWELQAEGGVAFRFLTPRGLVDGTATRAAYDSTKDLFVLDGSPGNDAEVRNRNAATGAQILNLRMPQFTLNAETLEINAFINQADVRPRSR